MRQKKGDWNVTLYKDDSQSSFYIRQCLSCIICLVYDDITNLVLRTKQSQHDEHKTFVYTNTQSWLMF